MQSSLRKALFLLALSALSAPVARAQGTAKTPLAPALPAPAPQVVTTGPRGEQFILGPDDVIAVQVANHDEMSADSLPVSPSGKVALKTVGPLTVAGKTLAQAQAAILGAYRTQLRDPKVSVSLVRARPRQATVLGAVSKPGAVDLQPGWRVSEVLAAAGGLAEVMPEEVRATLKHPNRAPVALDLATIYRAPENAANPKVSVGDVLSVVAIPTVNVTINGDVGKPGPQASRIAPRLLDVIGRGGDLKLPPSDSEVTLLRGNKILPLDVAAAFAAPTSAANITLQDGDLLSVQGARESVNVISDENLVKAPGNYQLEGHADFTRALSAAGGLTQTPDRVQASVRRGNQIIPVDIARAYLDPGANITLQNNDIIVLKPVDGPRVQLTGAVKSPGTYNFKPGVKVLDAVLQADSLTIPPDEARITILRALPNGTQVALKVDANRLMRGSDLSQNVTLANGDIVLVNPAALRSVAVTGQIEKPDSYELKPSDTLSEVLLRAGGPTPLAALGHVTVYRKADGSTQVEDYSNLTNGGAVPTVQLEDGDRVDVPINPNQVLVTEAVIKPGKYAIPEHGTLTLSDALLLAGGTQNGARTSEIALLRQVPVTKQNPEGVQTRIVPFNKVKDGKVAQTLNLPLQPGDVVFVPQGKVTQGGLAKAASVLSIFGAARAFGLG